jgi:ABC-type sugar transport system permease subunit
MSWFAKNLRNSPLLQQLKTRQKEIARTFWVILVVIAVIFILYKAAIDWKRIQNVQWHFYPRSLLAGFGVYSISLLLTACCWALIMGRISGVKTFWEHVRIFCLTNLSQRLPTLFPYLAARTEAYVALGVPREITLTAMAIEVAVTLLSATLVTGLTLLLGVFSLKGYLGFLLSGLLLAPMMLILFPQRFLIVVNKVLVYLKRPPIDNMINVRHTASWTGLFMIIWLNSGVLYYFLISGLCEISPEEIPFLISVSAVSGLAGWLGQLIFLPTPAVRQLALAYLMSLGFPMPIAVAFALFARVCVMIFELIWAGVWMIVPRKITFSYHR